MSSMLDRAIPWSNACYGLDVAGDAAIAVLAVRTGRSTSYSRVDLKDDAARARLSGGKTFVAGCLPERESFTRWLEAPFASLAKAEKVFPSLLDIQLPFQLDECAYAFVDMRVTEDRNVRALAAVARFPDVEKRLNALKALGFDAHALDQEGLALWTQSLREVPVAPEIPAESSAGRVVVYLSTDRATIAIGRGAEFIAAHTARQPRADDVERLLWAKLQPPVDVQWMWTGPGAQDAQAVTALHRELSAKWTGDMQIHKDPETFLARAVATRALLDEPLRCNLRAGALTHPDLIRRAGRRALTTGVLFLAAGVLLCGVNLTWRVAVDRRVGQVRDVVAEAASRVAGMPKSKIRGNELLLAQRALDGEARTMGPFLRGMEPSVAGTLKDLAAQAGTGHLRYDSLLLKPGAISIEGVAPNWAACEVLSKRLTDLGFRHKLNRGSELVDENIRFSITPAGL